MTRGKKQVHFWPGKLKRDKFFFHEIENSNGPDRK